MRFCVFLCVLRALCNHSSNLSARTLCGGDIKVLISTATQHHCHCEDTSDTSMLEDVKETDLKKSEVGSFGCISCMQHTFIANVQLVSFGEIQG